MHPPGSLPLKVKKLLLREEAKLCIVWPKEGLLFRTRFAKRKEMYFVKARFIFYQMACMVPDGLCFRDTIL